MAGDFAFKKAMEGITEREQRIGRTRLAAARLCLSMAAQSQHEALLADVLNHFGMTREGTPTERKACQRHYGFWLQGASELQLPGLTLPAPRAIAVRVQTDLGPATDDDGIGLTFHTMPDEYALSVQMQMFYHEPHWWRDIGETSTDVGEHLSAIDEHHMTKYVAGQANSAPTLEAIEAGVAAALLEVSWQETLSVNGNLF